MKHAFTVGDFFKRQGFTSPTKTTERRGLVLAAKPVPKASLKAEKAATRKAWGVEGTTQKQSSRACVWWSSRYSRGVEEK